MAAIENDTNTNISNEDLFYSDLSSLNIPHANVNVRSNIGDMRYMVSIRDSFDGFELKLQIENSSSRQPIVFLKDSNYSTDDLLSICSDISTNRIGSTAASGGALLKEIHTFVKERLKATSPTKQNANKKKNQKKQSTKNVTKKGQQSKTKENPKEKPSKLPSMKTSIDVINRILWDDNISQDDMVIGYVDRFCGILEKPFSAFSWEDIASVDYFTFAIPKHRIAYFKYKQAIVWHKEKRLDRVFNSLGNAETIDEVIRNYQEDVEKQQAREVQSDTSSTVLGFSDEDDDDVDVDVKIDSVPLQTLDYLSNDENDDENRPFNRAEMENIYWKDKLRPNFFICIRVTNPDIQNMAAHVHEIICEKEPRYDNCCTPPNMLHITLGTLRLHDAAQVSECVEILRTARKDLEESLPKSPLRICGLDKFFGRVLYAKVQADKCFFDFVSHLNLELRASGMPVVDSHEFVPHMSILKVNRPTARLLGTKHLGEFLYKGEENIYFGEQSIESVYLCSMEKSRGPDGFYITSGCITFMKEIVSSNTNNEEHCS